MHRAGTCLLHGGTERCWQDDLDNMMSWLTAAVSGSVVPDRVRDVLINAASVITDLRTARISLGVCPQFSAIDAQLSVREHLMIYGRLKGSTGEELDRSIESLLLTTGLHLYTDRLAGKLSGGNQRKLSLAIALIGNPPVVLIDEFSTGIDAKIKREMWHLLRTVARSKAFVITTRTFWPISNSMEEAAALATKVEILAVRLLAVGTTEGLSSRYATYEVHFTSSSPEHVACVERLVAEIPGARMVDDLATRFEIPTANLPLADLFRTLSIQEDFPEYTIEKATLENGSGFSIQAQNIEMSLGHIQVELTIHRPQSRDTSTRLLNGLVSFYDACSIGRPWKEISFVRQPPALSLSTGLWTRADGLRKLYAMMRPVLWDAFWPPPPLSDSITRPVLDIHQHDFQLKIRGALSRPPQKINDILFLTGAYSELDGRRWQETRYIFAAISLLDETWRRPHGGTSDESESACGHCVQHAAQKDGTEEMNSKRWVKVMKMNEPGRRRTLTRAEKKVLSLSSSDRVLPPHPSTSPRHKVVFKQNQILPSCGHPPNGSHGQRRERAGLKARCAKPSVQIPFALASRLRPSHLRSILRGRWFCVHGGVAARNGDDGTRIKRGGTSGRSGKRRAWEEQGKKSEERHVRGVPLMLTGQRGWPAEEPLSNARRQCICAQTSSFVHPLLVWI
ncbi:hypothetical protein B0H14DRAFT_3144716 [Mycena olivaceomarginata]|nr:hypothetical protein B0H14DRAFT_3144716 [Mycena olivaceomarginata]